MSGDMASALDFSDWETDSDQKLFMVSSTFDPEQRDFEFTKTLNESIPPHMWWSTEQHYLPVRVQEWVGRLDGLWLYETLMANPRSRVEFSSPAKEFRFYFQYQHDAMVFRLTWSDQ